MQVSQTKAQTSYRNFRQADCQTLCQLYKASFSQSWTTVVACGTPSPRPLSVTNQSQFKGLLPSVALSAGQILSPYWQSAWIDLLCALVATDKEPCRIGDSSGTSLSFPHLPTSVTRLTAILELVILIQLMSLTSELSALQSTFFITLPTLEQPPRGRGSITIHTFFQDDAFMPHYIVSYPVLLIVPLPSINSVREKSIDKVEIWMYSLNKKQALYISKVTPG